MPSDTTNSNNIDWDDTVKKEARGINDADLGEVQDVGIDYVLVQKGIIDKDKFYIPKDRVKSYDGKVLRFNITEEESKTYSNDFPLTESSSTLIVDQNNVNEPREETPSILENKIKTKTESITKKSSDNDKPLESKAVPNVLSGIVNQIFDKLSGQEAVMVYSFDNMQFEIPPIRVQDGKELGSAAWTVNGKIRIRAATEQHS